MYKRQHITNEMLENQPREEKAYEMFQEFMKEALEGKVIVCAHKMCIRDSHKIASSINR